MRKSPRVVTRVFRRNDEPTLIDDIVGRILLVVALLLAGAVILAAEARLPEDVRFGMFETAYVSP
jgi:hypothetical protein